MENVVKPRSTPPGITTIYHNIEIVDVSYVNVEKMDFR
jgi:hypothetical protein